MKPILHIINNPDDTQAIETVRIQGMDNAYGVAAVFTGGVPPELPSMPDVRICVLKEEPHPHLNPLPEGEEISLPFKGRVRVGMGSFSSKEYESINYDDLLNLIFSVESISVW